MTEMAERRRRDRQRLLQRLYERTEADVNAYEDGHEIARELALDPGEAARYVRYLEERGYVQNVGGASLVLRITADGIDQVEGV